MWIPMRRIFVAFWACMMCAGSVAARAQVAPSATRPEFSITAGGLFSAFQPDYGGGGIAEASPNRLYGFGAYADMRIRRWVQLEAEGRWLRLNQYLNINQDNYLIGPRVPISTYFGRVTPYGKILFGISHMNFEFGQTSCRCATIAYGGGADVQLTKRVSWRAIDFEYQQWPNWYALQTSQLHPYGFSTGIGYKLF